MFVAKPPGVPSMHLVPGISWKPHVIVFGVIGATAVQLRRQPSKLLSLPSSHSSPASIALLPQLTGMSVASAPELPPSVLLDDGDEHAVRATRKSALRIGAACTAKPGATAGFLV